MDTREAIDVLRDFLRALDHDPDDPTTLEEAIVEGIEALEAVLRAAHQQAKGGPS